MAGVATGVDLPGAAAREEEALCAEIKREDDRNNTTANERKASLMNTPEVKLMTFCL